MVKIETERSVSIITGVGEEKTERILEKTFANYSVDKTIIIGIGGGLKEDFKIGDFILCDSVLSETENKIYSDKNLLSVAFEVLEERDVRFSVGGNLTINSFQEGYSKKKAFSRRYPEAFVVDMEDYWIALECQRRGVPFLPVRIISDTLEEKATGEKLQKIVSSLGVSLGENFLFPFFQKL